jgi:hypothetical protein
MQAPWRGAPMEGTADVLAAATVKKFSDKF